MPLFIHTPEDFVAFARFPDLSKHRNPSGNRSSMAPYTKSDVKHFVSGSTIRESEPVISR